MTSAKGKGNGNDAAARKDLERRLKERTLVICKPEAVELGLDADIIAAVKRMQYMTPAIHMFTWTSPAVTEFYKRSIEDNKEKVPDLKKRLLKMSGRPSIAVVVQGPDAIAAMRKLAGGVPQYTMKHEGPAFAGYKAETLPANAPLGTIRGSLTHGSYQVPSLCGMPVPNMMHASDSAESYLQETMVLSKHGLLLPRDIREYDMASWRVFYGVDR